MKKKFAVLLSIIMCGGLLTVAGCNGLDSAKGIVEKAHGVIEEAQAVLIEVEQLIAGSDLSDQLQERIDSIQSALAAVQGTLESIAGLVGADLTEEAALTATTSVDRLKELTDQLKEENAKAVE